MAKLAYLTVEDLLHYYKETIQQSGGGMTGVRDPGGLEKVLDFI